MPIRFRCAFCNQLLGIARRKAGKVVRCPTCSGQVVVPSLGAETDGGEPGPDQPIFERSDFDQVFQFGSEPRQPALAPSSPPPSPAPAPAGAWGTHAEPAYDVDRLDPSQVAPPKSKAPPPPKGIVLSTIVASLIAVAVIIAIAVAFGAGFFAGRFLQ
jgi:hypothetical protein